MGLERFLPQPIVDARDIFQSSGLTLVLEDLQMPQLS